MRRLLLAFAFIWSSPFADLWAAVDAPLDFSVTVDAGRLRVSNTAPLPHVDNVAPFTNGSLLLIIAANGDGAFSSTLSPGNFIADNDIVLAAGGFNNSGGLDETITFFSVPTSGLTLPPNDRIALRWFPDITYAQYLSGTKPSGGQHFGTYNPRTSVPPNATDNPDGGDPWTAPVSGTIVLNFFTTDSGGGGTQQPSEGYASSTVSGSPTPTPTPAPAALLNISTRLNVLTNDNVLIGGFIVTGTQPKKVILRAIGPSLATANPPVAGALADPILELHEPNNVVVTNDNWKDTQEAEIIASTIPPTNDFESAIVAVLDPGTYTAIVSGKNGGTGVALVEAFDLDQMADSQLANISTRGFVETGDNVMIGGFFVGGGDASVIVRAIGPSLINANPPVPNALADPTLELHDRNGLTLAVNDNWKDTQEAEIIATTIPPTNDFESAIVATLPPAPYTAVVRGKNSTTGVALVEVYNITPAP